MVLANTPLEKRNIAILAKNRKLTDVARVSRDKRYAEVSKVMCTKIKYRKHTKKEPEIKLRSFF